MSLPKHYGIARGWPIGGGQYTPTWLPEVPGGIPAGALLSPINGNVLLSPIDGRIMLRAS